MKKVTIQDVAREMNLSRNTVARALADGESVADSTRKAVLKKAAEMGYGRLLPEYIRKPKSSGMIAIMAKQETSVFWNSIILGISDEITQTGSRLQLYFISASDESRLKLPADFAADAVLLLSVFSSGFLKKIAELNLPVVCLDAPEISGGSECPGDIIYSEGKTCVRKLTEHMVKKGLKTIGFIGDITYCKTVRERYLGFLEAMREAGLQVDNKIIAAGPVQGRYYFPEEVERAISGMPYLPDGMVCANDDIAFEVIRSLKKRKRRVPEDVLVTGFDDVESTLLLEPFLTTVHISNQKLGRRLVQQLLWRKEHPEFPREILCVEGDTVFRASTRD